MEEVSARSLRVIAISIDRRLEMGDIVNDDDVTLILDEGKEGEESSAGREESLRWGRDCWNRSKEELKALVAPSLVTRMERECYGHFFFLHESPTD